MPEPTRIERLAPEVAEVIAAGEVIERPVSVVKELVENSLDAGAGEIEVRILKGGKLRIEVADDGVGIFPEDLPRALERHATSKVRDAADLAAVRTFGFRGEALASIAAVARVTLRSRVATASAAAELRSEPGGAVTGPYPAARRPGTTVVVEELFARVPARRKFLRSDRVEGQRIRELLRVFAVAHPEVAWRFVSGERVVWYRPPADLAERLRQLHPDVLFLPVSAEGAGWRIRGLLAHPHHHVGQARELHTFVNRRYVQDRLLRGAVAAAYEGAIPQGRWPVGALFVDLDPARVDVNVHPAKTEVRFADPSLVFGIVREAVAAALVAGRRPPGRFPEADPPTTPAEGAAVPVSTAATPESRPPAWARGSGPLGRQVRSGSRELVAPVSAVAEAADAYATAGAASEPPALCYLGQVGLRYLLFSEADENLILVDQHAAHERIRYDRIMAALTGGEAPIQELLVAEPFAAEPIELEGFRVGADWLARVGFLVEPFGAETLRVRAVPAWFAGDPIPVVRETLRELAELGSGERIEREAARLAAGLACRGAILSGRRVAEAERRALLEQLLRTPGAETCPHGRPTYRRLTPAELDRWFGRS